MKARSKCKIQWLLGVLTAVGLCPTALAGDAIPMVGLDETGASIELSVSSDDYVRNVSEAVSSVRESTGVALARLAAAGRLTRAYSVKGGKPWKVKTVVVGAGAEFEVGLGPILKLKAVPKFRMAFSESNDPALP